MNPKSKAPVRRASLVGLAVLTLVLSACGSTVQIDGAEQQTVAGTPQAGSLDAPVLGDPLTGVPATDTTVPDAAGQPPAVDLGGDAGATLPDTPTAPIVPTDPSAPVDPTAPPSETPSSSAPPAPTTALRIGIVYAEGINKLAEAIGLGALSTGDTKAQTTALANYLNDKGGIGGREIELVYVDLGRFGGNPESAMEAGCRQLTEDDPVDLMITFAAMSPGNMLCFAKAGVGVVNDISTLSDEVMRQNANYLAAPGDFGISRMLGEMVDELWNSGWLTKSSKVGAFSYDDIASEALVNGALASALASHGLKIAAYQRVSRDSGGIAQAGSVVLRFRTAGIDRVIPVNASPLFVMNAASQQGYHPRYALYSAFGPGALLEGTAPRDQLKGAAGIGWSPYLDIGRGTRPGPVSKNETLCFDIMKDAGQVGTQNTIKSFQVVLCNNFFYLAWAAQKVGSAPDNLIPLARKAVGTSFSSASTFRTDVTSRVDGVAAYRPLTFEDKCGCFQYGPIRPTD